MAWHGDGEVVTCCVLYENVTISSNFSIDRWGKRTIPGKIFFSLSVAHAALGLPPFKQSFELEKRLANGVRERYACRVYKCYRSDAPALSTKHRSAGDGKAK
jgi:hypothetical protein